MSFSNVLYQNPQREIFKVFLFTLESGVDVGQGINVGLQKFAKKNEVRALNKCKASEF